MRNSAFALSLILVAGTANAQTDKQRAQRLFLRCQACHSIAAGEPDKIGPNLNGVVGRKAALKPGYTYSPALVKANLTWDQATLDAWLTRPAKLVPGTKMVFEGIAQPDERAALIAYLKTYRRR